MSVIIASLPDMRTGNKEKQHNISNKRWSARWVLVSRAGSLHTNQKCCDLIQ